VAIDLVNQPGISNGNNIKISVDVIRKENVNIFNRDEQKNLPQSWNKGE
jgi:hypothetical protein